MAAILASLGFTFLIDRMTEVLTPDIYIELTVQFSLAFDRQFPSHSYALSSSLINFELVLRLPNYILSLDYFIFTTIVILLLMTVFILTHPVNFPCGRKPEHLEKTHDFRQSVDGLFLHESVARIEPIDILYTLDSASLLVKLKPRIFQRLPPFE